MKTIYIVTDVELGWDNVIFASFNKEEAEKCKESRGGSGVLHEELVQDKFDDDED
jgi:hypothetical protein